MLSPGRSLLRLSTLLAVAACVDAPLDVPNQRIDSPQLALADRLPFSEAMAELGDLIFDDQNLSRNGNQACNACHASLWGFTGPSSAVNAAGAVYQGSVAGAFGDRKPPSSAYATPAPIFDYSKGLFVGGNF